MNWLQQLRTEYTETSMPYEDFLAWFLLKKLSWGQRWLLVLFIVIGFHFWIINPLNFLILFYLLILLALYQLLAFAIAYCKEYLIRIFPKKSSKS